MSTNTVDASNLLKNLNIAKGRGNALGEQLLNFYYEMKQTPMTNLSTMMPLLFNYEGKPLTLKDHFPMEPLLDCDAPREVTLMCSRQVGKSVQIAIRSLLNCVWTPHWNVLFVAPSFEAIRRISTDYFSELIDRSPARGILSGPGCTRQVLERTLPNQSRIRFTYAYRSADRARGIHARELVCDEYQLMLPDVMPVLTAVMDASEYGDYITRAGTPLTNANHLSREFKENSSRSHWMIPCQKCRKENIAALEYDLLGMIGPVRDDISRERPAIVCTKCGHYLYPWEGRFVHLNPQHRNTHLGLHVPSVVLPMHCCHVEKWVDLWKILSDQNVQDNTKYNESLGVPYDDGVTLLTQNDLERCAILNENYMKFVVPELPKYGGRVCIGVDWGGGGLSGESLTKVSVCALDASGKIHVLFGMSFASTATAQKQAEIIHYIWKLCGGPPIAHDNLGIGSKCEAMLVEKGVPYSALIPMEYTGETQGQIMRHRKASEERPRPAISVDKTRGLLHMIEAFRSGQVLTFRMTNRAHAKDLLLDLTHLRAEERVYVHSVKAETILIQREPGQSDDFAHAVHFAANWLWYSNDAWPRLTKQVIINTPQDLATYVTSLAKNMDPETIEALFREPMTEASAV